MDPHKRPRPVLAAVNPNAQILPPPPVMVKRVDQNGNVEHGWLYSHGYPPQSNYNYPPSNVTYPFNYNFPPPNVPHGPMQQHPLPLSRGPPPPSHNFVYYNPPPQHPPQHPLQPPSQRAAPNSQSAPVPATKVPTPLLVEKSSASPNIQSQPSTTSQQQQLGPWHTKEASDRILGAMRKFCSNPDAPSCPSSQQGNATQQANPGESAPGPTQQNPNNTANPNPEPALPTKKPRISASQYGFPITSSTPPPTSLPLPRPAPAPASKKRKASSEPTDDKEEIDIDDDRCQDVNISCDSVRTEIRNFLNSGAMKLTEFQRAIHANSKSYGSFMGQKGPYKGSNSCVYQNAFAFFRHRDLNDIKLPGEESVAVEVYDTCDEVRRKIRAYLTQPHITQAGFLRAIAKTYSDGRKIQSKVLNEFLSKKGPGAGNTSAVFYAGYVFFEKIRIKEGKEKSKERLEMEKTYDGSDGEPKGMDTKHRGGDYVFMF